MKKSAKKSLTRQFSFLTISILLIFALLFAVFLIVQNKATASFSDRNKRLNEKENLAIELDYGFNLAISEFRAYFAFSSGRSESSYKNNALKQQENIRLTLNEFATKATEKEDRAFYEASRSFYQYYFEQTAPKAIRLYESGDRDSVARLAIQGGGSENVRAFQTSMKNYRVSLDRKLEDNEELYTSGMQNRQIGFSILLVLLLGCMSVLIRLLTRRISKPLIELTAAASNIASGKDVLFENRTSRDDELGVLHQAFERMSYSIHEKEQDLSAQNEELLAQQDELQAQQAELEEVLEQMRDRENQLKLRNELINGMSNTLNKEELLKSIIDSLAPIARADKAMIVLMNPNQDHASSGAAALEEEQFLKNLHSGFVSKLKEMRKPFTVKRGMEPIEKGYHIEHMFCYDLFLPVFSSNDELEAVLLFTRYSGDFSQEEMNSYMALAKNISISLEKIKLYEQTEEERQLNRDIMNTVHEGIQLVDTRGTILLMNKTMHEIIHDWKEQPAERSQFSQWMSLFEPNVENQAEFRHFFQQAVFAEAKGKDNEPFQYVLRGDNETKVIKVYVEPLYRMDHRIGTVIVHRDITREYEVDKMKSEFVSTVSHELRTPLASVLGFTELMLHKELKPERQKKYLTTIFQEAKRLTALINDFLDVQRMEAGKQTYEKKYDDLFPILKQLAELQEIQTRNHAIRIERLTEQTIVLGDKDKLSQVFSNLISNAIKYSPNGGSIEIRLFEEEQYLNISIKDEGLGIPKEAMDKLFNKFYRVDNSDRRRIGGTGLGLAIAKEIVKAHEGTISVQSELGKGSVFTVRLPLVIQIENEPNSEEDTDHAYNHVIIIEDDLNLANLLKAELEESRFKVEIFTNGKEAIRHIGEQRPDAVVLDIMLDDPSYTGWDLLEEVKRCEKMKHVPIFISSALEEKEKGIQLGARDYLIKPYQPSLLSKLILQTLLQRDLNGQILIPADETDEIEGAVQ
ncbi:response regulator [Bacillus sp. FJAT-42376]|uniref:ATP-binding response regulator n=1 Tax=Bacillus sp. FJAT-42376 TaxID=2014076 RepID=UPI000F4F47E2|nr:ATP-binding protein [Bacillus sp. FJAT-42376]AZB44193.1 response regulator [Bacillus sp. FJAT-42376]